MLKFLTVAALLVGPAHAQPQQQTPAELANAINMAIIQMAQQIKALIEENERLKRECVQHPEEKK